MPRVLLLYEVHPSCLNSRLDIVALVALMVHGILWQVVNAWSRVFHQKLQFALHDTVLGFVPFVKGILSIAA